MIKQIEIHGQCFELYCPDDAHATNAAEQL
jgi:hypothetical protein